MSNYFRFEMEWSVVAYRKKLRHKFLGATPLALDDNLANSPVMGLNSKEA